MTRSFARRLVASAVLCLGFSGCSRVVDPGACTDELRVQLTPRDTAVSVGSAFTAAVALSTCGGRQPLADTFTFASTNAAAASVDAATGRVTAVGAGQADIVVTGDRYGQVGRIRLTVAP